MIAGAALSTLLDQTQDKIVVLDDEARFVYANRAVERILGYDPESLVGSVAFEFVHPADVTDVRAAFERTVSGEPSAEQTLQYRFRGADGDWVWLESRMSSLTHARLEGYVVSSRDVTERIEAERERQKSASRLRELSNTTDDVLWMFDGDWSELLFVNPAYEEIFGHAIEEVRDDPISFLDAVHPDDVPEVEDAMERLSAGEATDLEYRVNPDADYGVWVWVKAEPVVEDGEVVRITGFVRDVTDRYRRERQLYVMDNLLRHNLRNDLGVILGHAQLIGEETPEAAPHVEVIEETGERLLDSAEKEREIIDLLTSPSGRRALGVRDVILDGVETVQDRFPSARLYVSLPSSYSVYALPEVGRAIVELLENAILHNESQEPSVHVSARAREDTIVVVVEDDAPPIPAIESRVLEGAHEMDYVYHSSGLGLWLVYWLVELSGGRVTVHTAPDSGNRVRVALPRHEG
ncbi:MAG: PAS domain S-box protein [Halorientalis sp.]